MAEYEITSVKAPALSLENGYLCFYRPNLYIMERKRRKEMSKATKPSTYISKQLNRKGFFIGRNTLEHESPIKQDSQEYIEKKQKEISGQKAL